MRANEIRSASKVLAAKLSSLTSILRTHVVGEEKCFQRVVL